MHFLCSMRTCVVTETPIMEQSMTDRDSDF